jgi:beta-glucosidase
METLSMRRLAWRLFVVVTGTTVLVSISDHAHSQDRPWMNKSLSPLRRAELLVQQMTLDEKISQIHMIDKPDHPREVPGIERLGVPVFKITNGPAGAGPGDSRPTQPATAMPSALALAASWDPKLAETFGRVVADEVAAHGDDLLEAPGVNIARVPQNGRNFEYFGEDPYLAAQMVVPEIRGIQARGILAEVKHYAANNQENDRKTINEIIDERALREIYLPAFEAAVKEGDVASIMCAYPSVNGQFGCENIHLLREVLRGDWGFKGFVQSDYTATRNAVANATAGLDLAMKPDHFDAEMKAAIKSGQLAESVVDSMLVRRFSQMFRFGLFDKPRAAMTIPAEKDGAIARSIAADCAVLLRNQNQQLPLNAKAIHLIALIGPYAGAAHTGGGGSSAVTPLYTVAPVDGIKKHLGADVKLAYDDGKNPAAAAATAKSADVVLLMVGNKDREGRDRSDLSLPDKQAELVSAVAAANPHTIVILKTGGAVLMPWLDQVAAVLEVWYPGEEDGNVVADLVFGEVNPSGKLPLTFPGAEADVPAHTLQQYPGVNGTAIYSEGLEVGYRWFDSQKIMPLFPFGFGLSYTSFSVRNLKAPAEIGAGESLSLTLDVANTGARAGAAVVQVYVGAPAEAGEPPKQLKAFAKVTVGPNQTQQVTMKLDPRAFSIWSKLKKSWTTVPGRYELFAGTSSRDLPLHSFVSVRQ